MARYATCECVNCHQIVPKNEAHQVGLTQQQSGSVGMGMRFYWSRNGIRPALYTKRNFYRTKEAWMCNNCWSTYQPPKNDASGLLAGLATFGLIILIIWLIAAH